MTAIAKEEIRKCLKCGKEIGGRRDKKFCSQVCQTQFNALKHYYQHKDEPNFKAKRKVYFDKWRKENREHFNSLLREPNRQYQIKLRKKRVQEGVCLKCGKPRDDGRNYCSKCRAKKAVKEEK